MTSILTRFRVKRPRFRVKRPQNFKKGAFQARLLLHARRQAVALLSLSSVARVCCSFVTPFVCYNVLLSCILSTTQSFTFFPGIRVGPATTLLLPFTHFYGQEEVCIYAQYFSYMAHIQFTVNLSCQPLRTDAVCWVMAVM